VPFTLIVVGAILAFLLGWNNSGVIVGSSYGSGVLPYEKSRIIIGLGVLTGALLEGGKMSNTLFGGLVSNEIPNSQTIVLVTLIASILSLFLFTTLRIPCSLSLVTATGFAGSVLASNLTLDVNYMMILIASWIISPLVSAFLTVLVRRPLTALVSRVSLAEADLFSRLSVIFGIFSISYALGANNVGFLNGLYVHALHQLADYQIGMTILISASTIMGIALLGHKITEVVGEKFVVLSPQGIFASMITSAFCIWIFTQAGIPLSITHVLIGSVMGAALTKKVAIFNKRILFNIIIGATASSFLGLGIAFAMTKMSFP
jgi:PiT family inorganic phosphate transporter